MLPVDTQELFWRLLFEQPSHPADRTFHPVGSTKWELLDLISSDEVTKVLSRMKDSAPGPDGRKLKDVRALSPNQLAGHFNDIRYRGQVLPPDFGTMNGSEPSVQFSPEGVQTGGWLSGLGMVYPRVIRQHQDDLRPLNITFADVKAFNSVSHQSILVAAAIWEYHRHSWAICASCMAIYRRF